ncbi:HSPB1-associated protein 1 [Ischnura elegans]|uniref:HSPB1-associated protein 1 n=1 Tax=Ischnura elegans TaxID=197161 RepID=UPI001ED8871E|nr:HSPB1-associated protein 1 [Ischnura elegans]
MPTTFPSLKSLSIRKIGHPVVLKDLITKWNVLNWSLQDWAVKFGDKPLPFRLGSINEGTAAGEPIWERNCPVEYMTLKEFIEWESSYEGQMRSKWMYYDYKHMYEWFKDDEEFLKAIDWGCLGFYGRNGRDSTLWIGSHGAHTPCHADTYGFNLVAQLQGRKRWLLFPPDSPEILHHVTRVPYEESSIYVKGCVGGGKGGARGIVLSPGEVLLVPRGWWHRVDTEGPISISVNTWVSSEQDDYARLEESLVRFIFATTVKSLPREWQKALLNPNENDLPQTSLAENLSLVKHTLKTCVSQFLVGKVPHSEVMRTANISSENFGQITSSPPTKRVKPLEESETMQCVGEASKPLLQIVPQVGSIGWFSWDNKESSPPQDDCETLTRILDAFCHPDVISLVSQKMLSSSSGNYMPDRTSSGFHKP